MTDYVSEEELLERDDVRVTRADFLQNGFASYEREAAALTAAANAVKTVHVVANEAAMLALVSAKVGNEAKRTDTKTVYTLTALPATTLGNWLLTGRYELNIGIDNVEGLTDALAGKLATDGTAEDSNKLGGKTLTEVTNERNEAITAATENLLGEDDLVNDLTTGGTDKALTAQQGIVLKNLADGIAEDLGELVDEVDGKQDAITPATGWGTPSGTVDRTTFNTVDFAEAGSGTVEDLAKKLGALITDLKAKGLLAD